MGVSAEDIELAKTTQAAQRATGAKVQQIGVIVGVVNQRKHVSPPVSLTDRAMRKRGTYDQAALLLDQQALKESSPERAARARDAAQVAKELSAAHQHEFDFFGGGNVSIAFEYHDAVTERLRASGETLAKQHQAMAVLWIICRHLAWQTHECTKSAAELGDITGIEKASLTRSLNLLEGIGAITRVKKGRTKIITVTPEGAFRGNVHNHAQAVERYRLDVIEGGKD
jgi:DNA-binding MarR family transcriptional regulator